MSRALRRDETCWASLVEHSCQTPVFVCVCVWGGVRGWGRLSAIGPGHNVLSHPKQRNEMLKEWVQPLTEGYQAANFAGVSNPASSKIKATKNQKSYKNWTRKRTERKLETPMQQINEGHQALTDTEIKTKDERQRQVETIQRKSHATEQETHEGGGGGEPHSRTAGKRG